MADLIGQIAAGGAGVPLASALEQFKSGVQFATEQNAAGQKSKLADIAIQQGQKDLVAQDQINERRAIELDQLKKSMPLWDQQLDLNMQKMAHEAAGCAAGTESAQSQIAGIAFRSFDESPTIAVIRLRPSPTKGPCGEIGNAILILAGAAH